MRRILGSSVIVVAAAIALAGIAHASSSLAPPMSRIPGLAAKSFDLTQGRACSACRRDCYREFRIACGYSDYCRGQFTACMRACWEGYCR